MGFRFFEKNKVIFLLSLGGCLLMMLFPEITVNASKEAIGIWMNAVVPALLPFMVIAGCIKRTGAKHIAAGSIFPVCMAFLSGYPMGAKIAGELYREGKIEKKELHRILCYAMITGPAFLISGVGVAFYHTKMTGYILAFSHYAGALICGLVLGGEGNVEKNLERRTGRLPADETDTPFTDCILESFRTLGIVLVYIVLFMIFADFLENMELFSTLSEEITALLKGLLEMTVGCSALAECHCSLNQKLVLSSFVISFGGLSVIGQTMSMLTGCPVTLWQILKIKVLHGILSAIWTFTICTFVI